MQSKFLYYHWHNNVLQVNMWNILASKNDYTSRNGAKSQEASRCEEAQIQHLI